MKRNNYLSLATIVTTSVFVLVAVSCVLLLSSRVKKEYTASVGQEIEADAFRRYEWDKGMFTWVEKPDTSVPGERTGKIQVFPFTYQITLMVTAQDTAAAAPDDSKPGMKPESDTTAPEVTVQKVCVYAEDKELLSPEQFILEIKDESACTVEFISVPESGLYGTSAVKLLVKDDKGNSTEVETECTVINLKKQVLMEIGTELPVATDFLYTEGSEISFATDLSSINTMAEGSYEIRFVVDGTEAVSLLQLQDTTAPVLSLHKQETWLNKPLAASGFIDLNATFDNSDAFDAIFATEPDWSKEGEQQVTIVATDASGNSSSKSVTLLIKKDKKAPVVSVTDIDVQVGGTVSYKKAVSYYDDIDSKDEMKLSIERSSVNLKQAGSYEVTYTVTDCSGNSTTVVGKINVVEEAPKWEDEEVIHTKAKEILSSILKEEMTEREKAKAIYKWIKSNVGYIEHSEKGNYIRGAYEGLFKHQGDCFVYAATAKELLTLAEIPNIDIVKSTKNPSHYWNLVYMEDGWYHFDCTPYYDKSEFFLVTDAELEAYSSSHRNTHIFDRSLYPEIK